MQLAIIGMEMQRKGSGTEIRLRDGVRHDERRRLNLTGMMTAPLLKNCTVLVTELSRQGCRIHATADVHVGTCITLSVSGIGAVKGWIVWQRREELGVAFATDLPQQVVDFTVGLA